MYKTDRCYEEEYNSYFPNMEMNQFGCQPIYECPCEKVCHRQIEHVVEHIQPINTRIINHHIYRHTYTPCYTCSVEDEISNVYDSNPCGRM